MASSGDEVASSLDDGAMEVPPFNNLPCWLQRRRVLFAAMLLIAVIGLLPWQRDGTRRFLLSFWWGLLTSSTSTSPGRYRVAGGSSRLTAITASQADVRIVCCRMSWCGCSSLSNLKVVGLLRLSLLSLMRDVHVQLCSIGSLNVVDIIWAVLIWLVYASHHCNQGKLKSIGAVPLMYIFMQNHGIQPFVVERGSFTDGCLKGSENKMTYS